MSSLEKFEKYERERGYTIRAYFSKNIDEARLIERFATNIVNATLDIELNEEHYGEMVRRSYQSIKLTLKTPSSQAMLKIAVVEKLQRLSNLEWK